MKNRLKTIGLPVLIFIIAFGIGYLASTVRGTQETKNLISDIKPVRENNFNYKFIFPLLRYDFGNAKYYLEDHALEQKINAYIENQYQNKNIESISVFYSDLLGNKWAGVNEDTKYHPGSMMKVLIMMAYYREAQLNPSVMEQSFVYTKNISDQANTLKYSQPSNMLVGESYTVKELIKNMIENSDNGAETLLLAYVNQDILNDLYQDLNIQISTEVPDFTISVRNYSVFLKILYNSTYLYENNSEEALSIMSKTTFHNGIESGVPSDIIVSQKYGERVDTDPSGNVSAFELHDCGIVYAENPYVLCVMTKGNSNTNKTELSSVIKDISAIVYGYTLSNDND